MTNTETRQRFRRERVKKTIIFNSHQQARILPVEVLPEYGRRYSSTGDNSRAFSRPKVLASLLDLFVQDKAVQQRALKVVADLKREYEFTTSDRCILTAPRQSVERYKEKTMPIVGNSPDIRFVTSALIKMYMEDEAFQMKLAEFRKNQLAALTIAVIKSRKITQSKLGVKLNG